MSTSLDSPGLKNMLLAALPEDEYQRLLPCLELISLDLKGMLYEPDQDIEYVYFPLSGMASIVVVLEDGGSVEAGIVGNEGMVGLPIFWGGERTPTTAFYQVTGDAVRMRSEDFTAEIEQGGALGPLLQKFVQAFQTLLAQNSACNTQHSINERCARWLLSVNDRVGKGQFQLTQEFLSQMLGVRRAGVSEVMAILQKEGYIHYSRGMIDIVDRAGLESVACECYRVVADEYKRLLDYSQN